MTTIEKPTTTQAVVDRFVACARKGLVKGLGVQEPGKMCVEAAINYAFGLPHDDNPPCVGAEVRASKIALNDCNWSSDKARGEGMLLIGIAQLGSDTLNQEEYTKKLKFNTTKIALTLLIKAHAKIENEDPSLLAWAEKFSACVEEVEQATLWKEFYNYNNYYYYYNNNNNYYYYYYNNYNNYYNNYNYNYYYNNNNNNYNNNNYNNNDSFLLAIATAILQTLKDLNSPGCAFLPTIPSAT